MLGFSFIHKSINSNDYFESEYLCCVRKFGKIVLLCVQGLAKGGDIRGENFDSKRSHC